MKDTRFIVKVEKTEKNKVTVDYYVIFEEMSVGSYFKGGMIVECRQLSKED